MFIEIKCPVCGEEFEAEEWYGGDCPGCPNKYDWDEMITEDYSDNWIFPVWEKYLNV